MEALKELGEQSVLFGAERQAYQNGFLAGEQTAEKDVRFFASGSCASVVLCAQKMVEFSAAFGEKVTWACAGCGGR
eukprot:282142-Rhodomonas_salina.1